MTKILKRITASTLAIIGCFSIGISAISTTANNNEYICTNDLGAWLCSGPSLDNEKLILIPNGDYVYTSNISNNWMQVIYTVDDKLYFGWTAIDSYTLANQIKENQEEILPNPPMPTIENVLPNPPMPEQNQELQDPPIPTIEETLPNPPMPEQKQELPNPSLPNMKEEQNIESILPNPPMPEQNVTNQNVSPSLSKEEIKNKIYEYLTTDFGLNKAAACAIIVNIQAESNFNLTSCVVDTNDLLSYGLCQWNGPRYERLQNFCNSRGLNIETLEAQMQYLKYELENYYKIQYNAMKNIEDSPMGCYNAAYYWASMFEVCSSKYWLGRAESGYNYYLSKN